MSKRQRRQTRAFFTVVFLLTLTGCSLPGKLLRPVLGTLPNSIYVDPGVGIEVGLGAVQDAERRLCNPAVPAPLPIPACTPVSEALGLSTGLHRQISDTLAQAFALQKELAVALKTGAPAAPVLFRLAPLVGQLRAQTAGLVVGPETLNVRTALAGFEAALAKLQK